MTAAKAAGTPLRRGQIQAELLAAPHRQPRALPSGKQAIYCFCLGGRALKVGRAGQNSNARYTSQHYSPGSSQSNLAKSILQRRDLIATVAPPEAYDEVRNLKDDTVGDWIKRYTTRINLLLDADVDSRAMAFIESLIHQWLDPVFEGRRSRPPQVGTVAERQQDQRSEDTLGVTSDVLGRWRRCLLRLLDALDGGRGRDRGLKARIFDLSREGQIPRNVAGAMVLLAETRNVAEYEAVVLSRAAAVAASGSWLLVMEWARSRQLTLPPDCGT